MTKKPRPCDNEGNEGEAVQKHTAILKLEGRKAYRESLAGDEERMHVAQR